MSRVKSNFYKILIKACFFGAICFTLFSVISIQAQTSPPSSCSSSCPFDSDRICGVCPSGETLCYPFVNTASCTDSCVNYCREYNLTGRVCPDGSPLNILAHTDYNSVSGSCSVGEACCCHETSAGPCSGGGTPTIGSCDVRWPGDGVETCPLTCTQGSTFNISYEYRATDYSLANWIYRGIRAWNTLYGSWRDNLWCDDNTQVWNNNWILETKTISCWVFFF